MVSRVFTIGTIKGKSAVCVCVPVGEYQSRRQYIKAISHTNKQTYCTHTQAGTHPFLTYIAKANAPEKKGLDGFGSVTITQGQEGEKSVQQL